MSKYLYGASIQGIQEFIFETNKLKEIIGASEIVKSIKEDVERYVEKDDNILLNAAGNVKIVFASKERAEKIVYEFTKKISQKAYGITISQAVVQIKGDIPDEDEFFLLEQRLQVQRNIPQIPLDYFFSIMEKSPRTAKAAYTLTDGKPVDYGTYQKLRAFEDEKKKDPGIKTDLSQLSNSKNKIAVIHADGNSLGKIVPVIAEKSDLSAFSENLNTATEDAFKRAQSVVKNKKIRKIILGGDDMTCIVDADCAMEFIYEYLKAFEEETSKIKQLKDIGKENLTACAGVAIVNEKYPVYYALGLAEELCSIAKTESKAVDESAPSSVKFYNLQSGNFQNFELLKQNELSVKSDEEISFDYGVYYINRKPKLEDFNKLCDVLNEENSPKTKLREWLKTLSESKKLADLELIRINEMTEREWKEKFNGLIKNFDERLSLENLIVEGKTPVYDLIQIVSNTTRRNDDN